MTQFLISRLQKYIEIFKSKFSKPKNMRFRDILTFVKLDFLCQNVIKTKFDRTFANRKN